MNFRLKKDLPFAKAGDAIDKIRSSSGTEELSYVQIGNCKCQIPDRVNIFDWIEEVKPREWYIINCPDPFYLFSEKEMKDNLKEKPSLKFIKVCEVI